MSRELDKFSSLGIVNVTLGSSTPVLPEPKPTPEEENFNQASKYPEWTAGLKDPEMALQLEKDIFDHLIRDKNTKLQSYLVLWMVRTTINGRTSGLEESYKYIAQTGYSLALEIKHLKMEDIKKLFGILEIPFELVEDKAQDLSELSEKIHDIAEFEDQITLPLDSFPQISRENILKLTQSLGYKV